MDVDRCVMCGEPIPEGTMVCPNCIDNNKNKKKIRTFANLAGGASLRTPSATTWEYMVDNKTTDIPPTFRLWDSPIKNQLTKSTCVAHALASAIEIMQHYDTGSREEISTSWFYGYREQDDYQNEGMYISEALETARKIGGVPKIVMPDNLGYNESQTIISGMTDRCLSLAQNYRIKNYALLNSKYEIISAIYENKSPVIIGMETYQSFIDTDRTGIVPEPSTRETNYGGHAVLCVGWTTINEDIYLVIKNSWGTEWGDNGYAYLKLDGYIPIFEMYILFDVTDHPLNLTDINTYWGKEDIEFAIRCGIINGYEDGTFKPEKPITRGEMGVIVARLLRKTAMY